MTNDRWQLTNDKFPAASERQDAYPTDEIPNSEFRIPNFKPAATRLGNSNPALFIQLDRVFVET